MSSHIYPQPPGPPTLGLPRRYIRAFLQRRASSMRTTRTLATQPNTAIGTYVHPHHSNSL